MAAPKHVYETFIKATPDEVWAAITRPEFTERYFHETRFETELTPGAHHRYLMANGNAAVDGVVEEVEEGKRLVITWHVLYDAAMAEEPPGRVEWLLRPANEEATITRVTLRHFDLGLSPLTSDNVAVGWVGVLDGMKTLLETGESLGDVLIEPPAEPEPSEDRRQAATANNSAWELLAKEDRTAEELDELLERGYAAAYHWRLATDPGAIQRARAAWLLSRIHVVAGNAEQAMHHARSCADLTAAAGADAADFDHGYVEEALARAHAIAGDLDEAAAARARAGEVAIADDEDRKIFESDLADGPWFGLA